MRDLAIRNLYPLVVTINNETDVYDKDSKSITLDEALITVEINKLKLDSAKLDKKTHMIVKFNEVSVEPVIVNSITYNGGFDSALKLDGAKRLAELAKLTEVVFFDTSNQPHTLTIAEANFVILSISVKYQTDFAKVQGKKVLIDSKTKVSTVKAVSW